MKKTLKILASLSKSERVGLAVLLILLIAFICLPYLVPPRTANTTDFTAFKQKIDSLSQLTNSADDAEEEDFADYQKSYKDKKHTNEKKYNLVVFDPNTADANLFEQLGFSPKQAAVIVNYRAKGAIFRTAEDFQKVFVVSPEHFEKLKPYIQIAPIAQTTEKPKYDSARFQKPQKVIVELNTADTNELVTVRGIGMFTAKQIVKYREQLGGFDSIEQLRELKGLTNERFDQIAPQLTVNTALLNRIDLQTADEKTLKEHPYIGPYDARGIVHFRQVQGSNACTLDALVKNNVLKAARAEQLRPYLKN